MTTVPVSMSSSQNSAWLDQFVGELFDTHGFDAISEEQRNEFIPQFSAQLQQRLGLAAMKRLDADAQKQLDTLLSDDALEAAMLQTFWQQHIPDYEKMVQEELQVFEKEFVTIMAGT